MQSNIYRQQNEHFEVFTTVLSPQVHRGRCQFRQAEADKMVVKRSYKPHWPDELALTRGEFILVLFKDDEARWFGRLQNGQQGYFPASHVMELSHQDDEPAKDVHRLARRGSAPATYAGGTGALRLQALRRASRAAAGGGPEGAGGAEGEREGPILILKSQISLPNRLPQPQPQPQPQPRPQPQAHSSPSFFHRILSKHRRRSECHGSSNTGYMAD
ncbi:jouberin [Salmo salar]|uniref:Jouberin n=1 Tax=Salmo salar TaxID=8030 RepID=A0A1S3QA39_SALSA|nr:jouberin [Salmo salar]|eukprot:XP_014036850.1 PREDICTED: jouberin-like [Salmo salar]